MVIMGEGHILIDHIPLEAFNLMTSLLEAACIADLSVRRTRPLPREEVSQ